MSHPKCWGCAITLRGERVYYHDGERVCSHCLILKQGLEITRLREVVNHKADLLDEISKRNRRIYSDAQKAWSAAEFLEGGDDGS